ncbi:MAG: hypothetical protein WC376_05335 [Candidatus Nanoarchaeia archaeon]|jgi:hypothetical protein
MSLSNNELLTIKYFLNSSKKNLDRNLDWAWKDLDDLENIAKGKTLSEEFSKDLKSVYVTVAEKENELMTKSEKYIDKSIYNYHKEMFEIAYLRQK